MIVPDFCPKAPRAGPGLNREKACAARQRVWEFLCLPTARFIDNNSGLHLSRAVTGVVSANLPGRINPEYAECAPWISSPRPLWIGPIVAGGAAIAIELGSTSSSGLQVCGGCLGSIATRPRLPQPLTQLEHQIDTGGLFTTRSCSLPSPGHSSWIAAPARRTWLWRYDRAEAGGTSPIIATDFLLPRDACPGPRQGGGSGGRIRGSRSSRAMPSGCRCRATWHSTGS